MDARSSSSSSSFSSSPSSSVCRHGRASDGGSVCGSGGNRVGGGGSGEGEEDEEDEEDEERQEGEEVKWMEWVSRARRWVALMMHIDPLRRPSAEEVCLAL